MLDCFNEHFISAGFLFESSRQDLATDLHADLAPPSPGRSMESQFHFRSVSIPEVHGALKILHANKSAGPDGIDPFFLKLAADFIAEPLTFIFNLSLTHNEIPKAWKSAFVVPLLKGGESSIVNNYRPISKLCVISKVFEKLVSDQLKGYLDANDILSTYQSGFRKQHSTTSAALKVTNDIIDAVDSKRFCAALFIDLSKAFDTVDHNILINMLLHIGVSRQAASWFKDYLSARTQCVQLEGSHSSFLTVSKGVLCLGPCCSQYMLMISVRTYQTLCITFMPTIPLSIVLLCPLKVLLLNYSQPSILSSPPWRNLNWS